MIPGQWLGRRPIHLCPVSSESTRSMVRPHAPPSAFWVSLHMRLLSSEDIVRPGLGVCPAIGRILHPGGPYNRSIWSITLSIIMPSASGPVKCRVQPS